jgi:hypothetical protein
MKFRSILHGDTGLESLLVYYRLLFWHILFAIFCPRMPQGLRGCGLSLIIALV